MIKYIAIFIWVSFLAGQTHWTKVDSSNPVLGVGSAGTWDSNYLMEPCVIAEGDTFRMWYGGNDGTYSRIGYAYSIDKVNWIKYSGNPILDMGEQGSFDINGVNHPTVIFDKETYKMWYRGSGNHSSIGYAISDDGKDWTKVDSVNPVLDIGSSGNWDDLGISVPAVIKSDSTYYMWYAGRDASSTQIGLATSLDGIVWTKDSINPVINSIESWEAKGIYPQSIIKDSTTFLMWYGGLNSIFSGRTGFATSLDGTVWTKHPNNPILNLGSSGEWDEKNAFVGSVILIDTTYHMWYDNSNASSYGSIGYAYSYQVDSLSISEVNYFPHKFTLDQNYPNPFNPETTISYALQEASNVNVSIFNIMGQEIVTLINEHQEAGFRSVQWNGTDYSGSKVSGGMYLYRIQAGSFSKTMKMVLLK